MVEGFIFTPQAPDILLSGGETFDIPVYFFLSFEHFLNPKTCVITGFINN